MTTLTSSLIVSLIDRVTAPARAVATNIGKLQDRLNENNRKLDAMRGRVLEATAVAYGLARAVSAPIRAATHFETKLEDIAQKIDAPISSLPELGKEIRAVAREATQSASAIASGMDVLTGMGATGEDALDLLGPIGKAATAYNASITDLSQAGYAALDNLKVPADQFGQALDAMAQAGKAGAFELKDMATYFPALGAGYQALGQTGVPAVADLSAALQIVRKGTGDSASAATNLTNVLQKMAAPQTVKAFKKMGINLEKEMRQAAEAGMTPIEAITEITNKALGGDLSRLGYLFSDAQVQQGLRPLLQNLEEYRRIRAEAMAAQGVVEADYERRLQTGAMASRRFAIAMENVSTSIGVALLPALSVLAETIVPVIDRMAQFAENNPQLTQTILAVAAGLVALRVAALAAQFSFLWMRGGVLAAAIGGLKGVHGALAGVTMALTAMKTAASAVSLSPIANSLGFTSQLSLIGAILKALPGIALNAFAGVAAAIGTISAPVWLAVGAVVGLGLAIYNYWVPISEWVTGFTSVIYNALSGIVAEIAAFGSKIASAVGSWAREKILDFAEFIGLDRAAIEAMIAQVIAGISSLASQIIETVKGIPAAIGDWIGDIFTMNTYSEEATASFRSAGEQAGQAMVDGIKAMFNGLLEWFKELPGKIRDMIGAIDLSGLIKFPSLPSWLGGAASAANDNTRAAGGPIAAGRTYLVGEEGPELITPTRSGYVHTADETAAMASGQGRSVQSGAGAVAPTINLGGIVVQPSPGMDEQALAQKVAREIDRTLREAFAGGHWNGGFRVA